MKGRPKTRRGITVDMLEGSRLVVRHTFPSEVMLQAHTMADASLRAALAGRPYRGIRITARRRAS